MTSKISATNSPRQEIIDVAERSRSVFVQLSAIAQLLQWRASLAQHLRNLSSTFRRQLSV